MVAGFDIGLLSCKAVVFGDGAVLKTAVIPTGCFPRKTGEGALKTAVERAVAEMDGFHQ